MKTASKKISPVIINGIPTRHFNNRGEEIDIRTHVVDPTTCPGLIETINQLADDIAMRRLKEMGAIKNANNS